MSIKSMLKKMEISLIHSYIKINHDSFSLFISTTSMQPPEINGVLQPIAAFLANLQERPQYNHNLFFISDIFLQLTF
jgi:hypothetical protein